MTEHLGDSPGLLVEREIHILARALNQLAKVETQEGFDPECLRNALDGIISRAYKQTVSAGVPLNPGLRERAVEYMLANCNPTYE